MLEARSLAMINASCMVGLVLVIASSELAFPSTK